MNTISRFWQWFTSIWQWLTLACPACGTILYFGPRYHSRQHVYCTRRCYEIGMVIEQSQRRMGRKE